MPALHQPPASATQELLLRLAQRDECGPVRFVTTVPRYHQPHDLGHSLYSNRATRIPTDHLGHGRSNAPRSHWSRFYGQNAGRLTSDLLLDVPDAHSVPCPPWPIDQDLGFIRSRMDRWTHPAGLLPPAKELDLQPTRVTGQALLFAPLIEPVTVVAQDVGDGRPGFATVDDHLGRPRPPDCPEKGTDSNPEIMLCGSLPENPAQPPEVNG